MILSMKEKLESFVNLFLLKIFLCQLVFPCAAPSERLGDIQEIETEAQFLLLYVTDIKMILLSA